MRLSKLMTVFVAVVLGLSSVEGLAAAKSANAAKTSSTQVVKKAKHGKVRAAAKKAVKSTRKKAVSKKRVIAEPATGHAKTPFGIKGAALQPSKVSNKTYRYQEKGKTHQTIDKEASRQYGQVGTASYYGGMFHGRKTASGEVFNENGFTAAHKTLALGSYALVTNLRNGRKVIVKINDRGPFSKDRIIDLSKGAAREIGMLSAGTAQVRVEAMQVDSQGYISGKAAQTLYQLAKKEGLPLKIKEHNGDLSFKPAERASAHKTDAHTAKQAVKTTAKKVKKRSKTAKKVTAKSHKHTVKKSVKKTKTAKVAKKKSVKTAKQKTKAKNKARTKKRA